jgi:3-phosphoshikimate 1-carboxyvinyltransferase
MGAKVSIAGNSINVSQQKLRSIRANLSDCIDLLPTVAALAALANGTSEFTGIERARIKESNRVSAMKEGLEKLGIIVKEFGDRLTIVGLQTPKQAESDDDDEKKTENPVEKARDNVVIDSRNDHRIAMAFGILGTVIGGVTIEQAECVSKTYPEFWDSLKNLGGQLEFNAK